MMMVKIMTIIEYYATLVNTNLQCKLTGEDGNKEANRQKILHQL